MTTIYKFLNFIKREPVLLITAAAALISCIFAQPGTDFISFIDFRTIALLYCLMAVVSGITRTGFFSVLAVKLLYGTRNVRRIGIILVNLCFFSAMFVTNDVALIIFIPFSIMIFANHYKQSDLIRIVILQTVSANLGSMLTPVGNPQNLYLYSYFDLNITGFVAITLPICLISLIIINAVSFASLDSSAEIESPLTIGAGAGYTGDSAAARNKRFYICIYVILFIVCLLTVMRVLSWQIMLAAVICLILIFDRKNLFKADFALLLTFAAFFIFAGNLSGMDIVNEFFRNILAGREYITALLTSQIISNVPAAVLLSAFTGDIRSLVLGVNIGGLGTPIASLASLISMQLYFGSKNAQKKRYIAEFTVINIFLLLVLSAIKD